MDKSTLYFNRIALLSHRLQMGRGNAKVLRAEIAKAYAAWDVYLTEVFWLALAAARHVRS